MAATIGAIAALASAGVGIYGAASAQSADPTPGRDAMQNSLNNEFYQRLLNSIALRQSTSGFADSSGSRMYYDPTTNTWKSELGELPQMVQNASDIANIERNTTDMRQGRRVNDQAELRALMAGRGADTARRAVEDFRPMESGTLRGLLQDQSTAASDATLKPIIADTLRQYARQGTSAAPAIAELGRTSLQGLDNSMRDNAIAAITKTGDVNNTRLGNLTSRYSTLSAGATPQLQFGQLSTSNPRDTMTSLMASRAKDATSTPVSAGYSVPGASKSVTDAATFQRATQPNPNFGRMQAQDVADKFALLGKGVNDPNSPLSYFSDLFGGTSKGNRTAQRQGAPGSMGLDDLSAFGSADPNNKQYGYW